MTANPTGTAAPIELMREAYRRIGIEMKTKVVPQERGIREAGSGDTDGILALGPATARSMPDVEQVPEPVFQFDLVGVTTGLDFPVQGWQSLAPYRLCILRGARDTAQQTKGMQVEIANSITLAVAMLRGGRCDVAVIAAPAWRNIDALHFGRFHELSPPISKVLLYHYVHRRNAGLVAPLDEALRAMRRDGTAARIIAAEDQAVEDARQRNGMPD